MEKLRMVFMGVRGANKKGAAAPFLSQTITRILQQTRAIRIWRMSFADLDRNIQRARATLHEQGHGFAAGQCAELLVELVQVLHLAVVHTENHVTTSYAGLRRAALGIEHQQAVLAQLLLLLRRQLPEHETEAVGLGF